MYMTSNNYILRDGLLRLFDSLTDERIIYVCAPAGYGKTVAVRQWLDSDAHPKAVISLDEYDNNATTFCERFCDALQCCQPQNTALVEIASHPAFGGAPDEFAVRAVSALFDKERSILVVDDLHAITDERVLRLMLVFLSRLPKTFQIVLISRHDLPPGFSDLWIRGHLVKITAEQLLLSREEVMWLYKKRGNSITPEQAGDICRFTGGWAIGVSALLLSDGEPSGENLTFLHDFIRNNLWERWDADTRDFMLKTAIAWELPPSLCNALTDDPGSEKILNQLVQKNAFISRTGSGGFRYHQLFQDFLQCMIKDRGDDFFRVQWNKAGNWYLSQNDFYNAMECFIKCENHAGIAQSFGLLVAAGHEYLNIEKMISVAHISMIDEVAEKYPYIYSTLSWAAFNEGNSDGMARYADLYYINQLRIVQLDPRLQFNIALVRLIDFRQTLRELMQAPSNALVNFTIGNLSDMGVSMGTINQNMPLLHRGTRDFSECAVGNVETNVGNAKTVLGGLFGDRATLLAECLVAGLLYEQGHLEKAYAHALAANAEINGSCASESKFCAMSILINILDAMGLESEAEQTVTRLASMIEQDRAYYLNYNFHSVIARRKLSSGGMLAAKNWLSMYNETLYTNLSFYKIYATFTTCRAYITVGDYDSAIILLTKTLELVTAYNRPLGIIEAQILLSISYWKKKRGFQGEAMRFLENAVSVSYSFRYTQLFVNEGAELAGLMQRLQRSVEQRNGECVVPASFIKMLYIKMLDSQNSGLTSGQSEQSVKYTDKQKTVMKQLCEGKSFREIAENMGIKLPTLRSHIALIYNKLDVTSEADAIKKIKSTGLLDEV